MTVEDIHLLPLVTLICSRPRLYTAGGSLPEVVAFLDGYYTGLRRGGLGAEVEEWERFGRWLAETLGADPSVRWAEALRAAYPNEGTAIARLGVLFTEFRSLGGA